MTLAEYSLPSTLTVTLPVAFSGRVTVIVPFSPDTISPTVMLIGESYLGAVMSVVFTCHHLNISLQPREFQE